MEWGSPWLFIVWFVSIGFWLGLIFHLMTYPTGVFVRWCAAYIKRK